MQRYDSFSRDPYAQGYQGYRGQSPSAQGEAEATQVANTNSTPTPADPVTASPSQQVTSPYNPATYRGKVGANWGTYQTQLSDLYNRYLGRAPGSQDYVAHAGSPDYGTLTNTISTSPEARAYATRQQQTAQEATYANPTATPVQSDGTVPPASVPIATVSPQTPAPQTPQTPVTTPVTTTTTTTSATPDLASLLAQTQAISTRQPAQGMPNYSYLTDVYRQLIDQPAFNPDVVHQMKEVQKEQQLSMLDQLLQASGDRYASQNRFGSGAQLAGESRARQDAHSNILNAFRDIDIDTAGKNVLQQLQGAQGLAALDLGQVGAQDQALNNILNWARFFDQGALARAALGLQGAQLESNNNNLLLQILLGNGLGN